MYVAQESEIYVFNYCNRLTYITIYQNNIKLEMDFLFIQDTFPLSATTVSCLHDFHKKIILNNISDLNVDWDVKNQIKHTNKYYIKCFHILI